MTTLSTLARRALLCAALLVPFVPMAVRAAPVSFFVPFTGQGNVSVFDATAGTGGWVGSIDEVAAPGQLNPLSLVSVVLFTIDRSTHTLVGSFDLTTTDLLSSLSGALTGTFVEDDILTLGGQFSLDYDIRSGSGQFAGASGFGLAFLDFMPGAVPDNYQDSGLLAFSVPVPATLALVLTGLLAAGVSRRKARPLN